MFLRAPLKKKYSTFLEISVPPVTLVQRPVSVSSVRGPVSSVEQSSNVGGEQIATERGSQEKENCNRGEGCRVEKAGCCRVAGLRKLYS